jgi:hypothetical protein
VPSWQDENHLKNIRKLLLTREHLWKILAANELAEAQWLPAALPRLGCLKGFRSCFPDGPLSCWNCLGLVDVFAEGFSNARNVFWKNYG